MRALYLFPFTLLLASCELAEVANAREEEDFHFTYPLTSGGRFAVENYNGSVEITGWDQNQVEIHGTKFARSREQLADIKIETQNSPDSVSVRTVAPGVTRNGGGARYIIRVPRRVELERITSSNGSLKVEGLDGSARLRTSNGAVRISQHKGAVDITTSNGSIEARELTGGLITRTSNGRITIDELEGTLEASTSNGSINASVRPTQPDRSVRLSTTNGSIDLKVTDKLQSDVRASTSNGKIRLQLPSATNARLSAKTSNSSVSVDFDLHGENVKISKHSASGLIGAGGPLIDLTTTNGSVVVSRVGN